MISRQSLVDLMFAEFDRTAAEYLALLEQCKQVKAERLKVGKRLDLFRQLLVLEGVEPKP